MRIREIRLREFKKFSDTTVTDIPITARLVMLVGPNGSGKSSLIDAAYSWHRNYWRNNRVWDESYHRKQIAGATAIWQNAMHVDFHDPQPENDQDRKRAIYARSAYRNEPEFTLNSLHKVQPALDEQRLQRLIDNDQTVSANYLRLVAEGFQDVYENAEGDLTLREFRELSIGEIRGAMLNLFPGLLLNSLGNPLENGSFRFDKGDSSGFLYKNLSGGEKAAFDLILDILVKRKEFCDTVFFIDEPEAHISPSLQSGLLDALLDVVPNTSQLWLATHSIGMMRRARDISIQNPGSVVFLDFDGINFDAPQILRPTQADRPFWKRAMHVALDDLAGYVTPEHVVLCEGGRLTGGSDFDADCYNVVFSTDYPNAVFFGAGNAHDIQNDPRGIGRLLGALAPDVRITRVIDRDDRTDDEIAALEQAGVRVLSRRTIESYLLDDTVLTLMCMEFGRPEIAEHLTRTKATFLERSVESGGPADDYKRIAGDVYNEAKRLFRDRRLGNDSRAFMKGFCAPLLNRVPIYQELRQSIFGQV